MKNRFLSTFFTLRAETQKRFRGREGYPAGVPLLYKTHDAGRCFGPREFCFQCDGCGCEFAPTPDSFILTDPVRIAEADTDQPTSIGWQDPLSRAALESLNEFELAERGLTEEGRQTLLRGEALFMAADAFCANCLRQLFS
jgi:hypothetical protein